MDAQIGLSDALRWVFPTTVSSYLQFRGWIRQETCATEVQQHLIRDNACHKCRFHFGLSLGRSCSQRAMQIRPQALSPGALSRPQLLP